MIRFHRQHARTAVSLYCVMILAAPAEAQVGQAPPAAPRKNTPPMAGFGSGSGQQLVGKPAPAFVAQDLKGQPVGMEQFKDRIILLDFWATWCAPCIRALPEIQQIANHFEGKAVAVVGVNRDFPGAMPHIKSLIRREKIRFTQIMDPASRIAGQFGVQGIPAHVLIDARGIVQDFQVGYGPGSKDHLIHQIQLLLDGKSLPRRAIPPSARRLMPNPDNRTSANGPQMTLQQPERLTPGDTLASKVNAFRLRPFDYDGDGRDELVMPSWGGGVLVVDAAGRTLHELQFEGLEESGQIVVHPVRLRGTLHWIVARGAYRTPTATHDARIGLYSETGKALWVYEPPLSGADSTTITLAAGDLGADGSTEIVVGMTVYKLQRSGTSFVPGMPRGYILVFSEQGQVLSIRESGQSVDMVYLAPGESAAGASAVLVVTGGNLQRFVFE